MMRKKIFAIGLAGLTVASVGTVAAMPNYLKDNSQIQHSLNSADYDDFVAELELLNPEMANHMSEHRFDNMIEQNARWEAVENNDYEAWIETFPENSRVTPSEEMFLDMVARQQNYGIVEDALEAGDYEAWKSAVEMYSYGKGMSNIVTEDDFIALREIHSLREEGNYEAANSLVDEEDFGMNAMQEKGRGMHDRFGKDRGMLS